MELSVCVTDGQYEAWRAVRLAVEPGSRTHSLEELREQDSSDRLLLLAVEDGDVVGCGIRRPTGPARAPATWRGVGAPASPG
jgi:mycothiol synthase